MLLFTRTHVNRGLLRRARRLLTGGARTTFRLVLSVAVAALPVVVGPAPTAYAATPGYYIAGDGSGGGASGDYFADYGKTPTGGAGGGDADAISGTSGDDVIFGDGSGGGGGGSNFRNGNGGAAGGGADTIDADAGDDIVFGDGFTGGTRDGLNGGPGGFGGGGGGGGASNPSGNGGTGGILGGGGGAHSTTTTGTSQFGGYSGGPDSKPAGGSSSDDSKWGGNSAIPTGGSGWFTDQSRGGSAYNCWGAAGGAGFGGGNTAYQMIASGNWVYNNGGWGDGNNGYAGSTTPVHYDDSDGSLWTHVHGQLANIFSTAVGTTYGVGAGVDSIDGGAGSDDLFGCGGNDTFVFERDDAGSSDTDTVWDFDRLGESDKLSLYTGGTLIAPSARDALIAAQTTSGDDRSIVFADGGSHSVTITVKDLARDLVASDFNALSGTPPTVVGAGVSSVTSTTASSGGNVTAEGSSTVTARGVCWGTSANPTTADSHTTDASGTGSFTSSITALSGNTRYHVRAYATNEYGTSYGSDVSFFYDNGAPVTTATGLAATDHDDWRTTAATVSLTASDALSGVASTEYGVDGGAWTPYSTPVSVGGSDGSHSVIYRSTDVSGNVETTRTGYVNIDSHAPTTTASGFTDSVWRDTTATVSLSATDAVSGVAGTRYSLDGAAATTYTTSFDVSDEGTTALGYCSVDEAGNVEGTHTASVLIDRTAPETTDDHVASYTGPATIHLSVVDTLSGPDYTNYSVDSGTLKTGTVVTVSSTGAHTLAYASTDEAGNTEATKTVAFTVANTVKTRYRTRMALTGHGSVRRRHTYELTVWMAPRFTKGYVRLRLQRKVRGNYGRYKTVKWVTRRIYNGRAHYRFRPYYYGHWRIWGVYKGGSTSTRIFTPCSNSKFFRVKW